MRLYSIWRGAFHALMPWLNLTALLLMGQAVRADELSVGRLIYTEGKLENGAELHASRAGRAPMLGTRAACVNCHRPSGMGQVESDIQIPPITGNYLFASQSDKRIATMDLHVNKRFNQAHTPYTDATLTAAIRHGINSDGREMNVLMPRFDIDDSEMASLIAYLKQLSAQWSPGVTGTTVRFATVITPDVDPTRRKLMRDMAQAIVRQKNSSTVPSLPASEQGRPRRHMTTAAELMLGTERNWDLSVWELHGEASTWGQQLRSLYQQNPVFALVSGVSNTTWQPMHEFCAQEKLPCWFPSVNLAGDQTSAYAFYFSGGVQLEAKALAQHLTAQRSRPGTVVQVHTDDELGRAAARGLRLALVDSKVKLLDRPLRVDLPEVKALQQAMLGLKPKDVLVLWLRPDQLAVLEQVPPPKGKTYLSGSLARGEFAPLPAKWRLNTSLVYPYELPEKRAKNLEYFHVWMAIHKMPMVDEIMQSEVFFAFSFMTDLLSEMLDNIYRDYLLERAETMLSKREAAKAEMETRDRYFLGKAGDLVRRRGLSTIDPSSRIRIDHQGTVAKSEGTTIYPHLSLASEQRLASKSAYIVRFAQDSGTALVVESEQIVP